MIYMKVPKITIDVPESPFTIKEVNGCRFLVTHGDILSGGGSGGFAGISYYSLASSSAKMLGALSQIGDIEGLVFNNIIMGHLHSTASVSLFQGGVLFINGCLIGTNEFSLHKMKSIAKVEQTMLIVNSKGRVINNITLFGENKK